MLTELIFPYFCIGCGLELQRNFLCEKCKNTLFEYVNIRCPVCQKRLPDSAIRHDCIIKLGFRRFIYAMPYKHPLGQAAIHNLKYLFIKRLANPLAASLTHAIHSTASDYKKYNLLAIPVPLAQERLRWRGFNQSALICKTVSVLLDIEMTTEDILIRSKNTRPQLELKRMDRLKNISGAFTVTDNKALQGRNILLIDDVATTCATLKEATAILKQNGARSIWAAVVAKE